MQKILDYKITELVYESSSSRIYRAHTKSDQPQVILKVLNKALPTSGELASFRAEYEIVQAFAHANIIKVYNLHEYENSLVIAMEDFEAQSLARCLKDQTFSMEQGLHISQLRR